MPLPSGTGAASSVVDAAPAQPTPYPGRVVLGHDTQGVSLAQLQGAPDGALLAYLRVLPAAAPGRETGPCEALRLDAQGQASIVTTTCPSWDDLPSPDGAKIVRLVTRPALAALMAPSRDVFVEDATTHERWFVDHGWMQGLDREASIVWSARGHRMLVPGRQLIAYDADTHRVWKVNEMGFPRSLDDDGETVAIVGQDWAPHVVRIESHAAPVVLPPAKERPAYVALAGDRLAAVTASGDVTVWDVARQEIVATWEAGFNPLQIAWVRGGALLAVADATQVRLSPPDGFPLVMLAGLRHAGLTTWIARDAEGMVDGPPAALAAVRWQLAGGEVSLDVASTERVTRRSPVRAGMIGTLLASRMR